MGQESRAALDLPEPWHSVQDFFDQQDLEAGIGMVFSQDAQLRYLHAESRICNPCIDFY